MPNKIHSEKKKRKRDRKCACECCARKRRARPLSMQRIAFVARKSALYATHHQAATAEVATVPQIPLRTVVPVSVRDVDAQTQNARVYRSRCVYPVG